MNKYPLIGGSILVMVLLVLGSLSNVVGFQTVQSSNQKMINEEINQKELLFQTILDIANNKEIQKVILGSGITGKRFFEPGMRFSTFTPHVLTEKFLKRMYTMSVILTKTISKSKMQSMIKHYQVNNQKVQNEISTVIERDAKLKGEITQLSNSKCDCENNNTTHLWNFPILCLLLLPFEYIAWILFWFAGNAQLNQIVMTIAIALNCFWIVPTPP
jgi:hypothetical protein